tara:strand:+ start:10892 stop:11647 length:756 start_codon:yes stop_codon:yes gene_type:complete
MKKLDIKLIIIIVLAGLAIFFWWRSENNYNKYEEQVALTEVANDSLETWVEENGIQRARIRAFETRDAATFLKFKTTDSLIIALQGTVKKFEKNLKNSGSVTIFKTETRVDSFLVGGIEVLPGDTIIRDSFLEIYPKYKREFDLGGWITGEITMGLDTLGITGKSKNEYTIVIGEEKQKGWFKKPLTFVDVYNANPFSETVALRTYKVKKEKKRVQVGVGSYLGYGVTRIRDGTVVSGVQLGGGLILKLNF